MPPEQYVEDAGVEAIYDLLTAEPPGWDGAQDQGRGGSRRSSKVKHHSALPPDSCKRLLGHPAGDCVSEAVAVSSEGGAVEEGEVEAGEAVHGLPKKEGGPIKWPKWAR